MCVLSSRGHSSFSHGRSGPILWTGKAEKGEVTFPRSIILLLNMFKCTFHPFSLIFVSLETKSYFLMVKNIFRYLCAPCFVQTISPNSLSRLSGMGSARREIGPRLSCGFTYLRRADHPTKISSSRRPVLRAPRS